MEEINEEKEWNTGCLKFIGIFLIATSIILLFIADFKQDRANRSNCERVGGKYEVVGQEYIGKIIVDIYGCVK